MNKFEFPKFDETSQESCVVNFCGEIIDLAIANTENSCVFAREGSLQLREIIKDIKLNKSLSDDYDLLVDLCKTINKNTKCQVMREATEILLKMLNDYEDEYDKHIKRGVCKNLVCDGMYNVYIDPDICTGCGECKKICPSILGSDGMVHVITSTDMEKQPLISCCKVNAIKKYGQIKPKTPLEPIPIGTFVSEETGGRKRKKRNTENG